MATIGNIHAPDPFTCPVHGSIFKWRHTGDPGPVVMIAPEFELVPLRTPEGLILYFKHLQSDWMFRVIPVRDPDQPRLWCIRMEPCAGPSLSAKTARVDPFYTSLAMTREQLGETLIAIRQGTAAWLQAQTQRDVLRWLTRIVKMPIPIDFIPPDPPARSARTAQNSLMAAHSEESPAALRKMP